MLLKNLREKLENMLFLAAFFFLFLSVMDSIKIHIFI